MSTDERILLTPQGKEDLVHELEQLRYAKRPQLLERIQELSSEGDVSDNSEYEDVKEELVQLESRIREIENILSDAQVVEHEQTPSGAIGFGAIVTLVDADGVEETWTIVGPQEANARLGRISNVSPVGSALLGKRVGDTIVVSAPGGETRFTIKEVR
ncbi:MAG: transcription elongation factor GreA [Chloroflexi bacterium]|nr:MAG: transcription elongation factor GreA [Chloroflexota bacterium]